MVKGYWIIFRNDFGCELDREFVKTEKEISVVVIEYAEKIQPGDSIKVEEGESEQ